MLFIEIKENGKELLELNSMKDKCFSILAHDLHSPMSGLYSLSNNLNENIESLDQDTLKNMLGHLETISTGDWIFLRFIGEGQDSNETNIPGTSNPKFNGKKQNRN